VDLSASEVDTMAAKGLPAAHEVLETEERRMRIQQALQNLPEILRSTLVLAYIKELSMDDIAEIESCAVGTVKSRIFRGKQLLRAALARTED
jgi:RNA polymerase sigma-70 factor (ECF subfamily)